MTQQSCYQNRQSSLQLGLHGWNINAPQPNYPQQGSAPCHRTAIACRYCRRRKIRCSGFEAAEDGRCSNCMKFNQDCIFTPMSAQTHAFVPAHTIWRGVGQPPPTYGAYGQPIHFVSPTEPYGGSSLQPQVLTSPTAGLCPARSHLGPRASTAETFTPFSLAPSPAQSYHPIPPPHEGSLARTSNYKPSYISSSLQFQLPNISRISHIPSLVKRSQYDNGPARSSIDSSMLKKFNRWPM